MEPDNPGVFYVLIVQGGAGSGEFIYDAAGNLRSSNVGQATTDPVQGISCPQGFATYNGLGAVINLLSTSKSAFFQYNDLGTSVQGALILSVASTASTDPILATAYPAGLQGIDPVFGTFMQSTGAVITMGVAAALSQNGRIQVNKAPTNPTQPFIVVNSPEQGTSGHLALILQGASPDATRTPQLLIASEPTGFTNPTPVSKALAELQGALAMINGALPAFVSTAFQAASVAGVLTGITGSGGLSGAIPLTQTDATIFTVTATGGHQASKAWSIPANDANAGTLYRLTVWGFGTEGSTAQQLLIGLALNGTNIRTVTAPALTLSGAFRFKIRIELRINTTGAGGTAELTGDGVWATTATPDVSNAFAAGSSAVGQEAFNTTIANTMSLQLGWVAVVGGPTITTLGSLLERLGP